MSTDFNTELIKLGDLFNNLISKDIVDSINFISLPEYAIILTTIRNNIIAYYNTKYNCNYVFQIGDKRFTNEDHKEYDNWFTTKLGYEFGRGWSYRPSKYSLIQNLTNENELDIKIKEFIKKSILQKINEIQKTEFNMISIKELIDNIYHFRHIVIDYKLIYDEKRYKKEKSVHNDDDYY